MTDYLLPKTSIVLYSTSEVIGVSDSNAIEEKDRLQTDVKYSASDKIEEKPWNKQSKVDFNKIAEEEAEKESKRK